MHPFARSAPVSPRPPVLAGRYLHGALLLGLLVAAAGCRDAKVTSYRIPKEKDAEVITTGANAAPAESPAAPSPAKEASPASAPAGAGLTWTAPAAWQAKELGPMRKGSYTVAGTDGVTADLSITAFPGAVGGELANINRWRGQVSLAPLTEAEVAGNVTRISSGDLAFAVVDLVGPGGQPQRILGAMTPFDGAMWFFKLSGPEAFVSSQKPAFLAFLKTVRASTPATP